MNDRCRNESHTSHKYYAAKGIKVCERWAGDSGFQNFLEDMGERPEGKTLDRIDSSEDYSIENCRWATRREQRLNTSRTNWITYNGKTLCLSDWEKECGISREAIRLRIKKGWSVEKSLTTPARSSIKRRNVDV
jgi:hypothetical protein